MIVKNFLLILCLWACSLTLRAQFVPRGQDIDGEAASDLSGRSISISDDGMTVAIGAPSNDNVNGENAGHVRVYRFLSNTWMQLGEDIDGEEAESDQSHRSVSLSADGNTIAIGAPSNDNANGEDAGHVLEDFGRVRVYRFLSDTWTQLGEDIDGEAEDDNSGISVSLSNDGHTVAIGAYLNDNASGANAGHVRVYRFSSDTWTQLGQNIDGEAANNRSGISVSLSEDGHTVAIGAFLNDNANGTSAGHVRVYRYASSTWTQLGEDIDGEAGNDRSGTSVSLSADGHTVAIGAYLNDNANGESAGHVRVYRYASSTWTQLGQDINGEAAGDRSGWSTSLSADGTTVAIGAYNNDNANGAIAGHARVYHYASSTWTQLGQDINGEAAGNQSGYAISLSADGTTVAIGAPNNDNANGTDAGHVRVYDVIDTVSISAVRILAFEGADVTFMLERTKTVGDLTVNIGIMREGDYTEEAIPTTVTFADGSATTALAIATDDDDIDEVDGSVTATIASGTTYLVGDPNTATVTVADDDLPVLTIAGGASVTEGEDATFTLTRTTPSGALTVNVSVTDGDADYVEGTAPSTVDFTDGSLTATLTVSTEDDEVNEADGSITATIESGTDYRVGDPSMATVTVEDNDLPEITIAGGASVTEGEDALFTLTRMTSSGILTVNVSVTEGDGDYVEGTAPSTVDFVDGSLTATLTVSTEDDEVNESDGSITATIESGTGYRVGDPSMATVTVEDNDLPIITIAQDVASVAEGADAVFTLTRTITTGDLMVNVAVTEEGEYIAGTAPMTVAFADGEPVATLTVSTEDDAEDEPSGVITATVQDGMGYAVGNPSQATVSVTDDDGKDDPEVTIAAVATAPITEGADAVFTLTRTITTGDLMVNVAVTEEGEYIAGMAPMTVTFADGEATAMLTVATEDDAMDEADGSITVTVEVGTGYILASLSAATVTVEDNDLPIMVTIAAAASRITEGADAVFTLTRTVMAGDLTVNVEVTQDGEYIDGTAPTTADFANGEATATLAIPTEDDDIDEPGGAITVTVKQGTGYAVGDPSSAEVAVADDDGADDPEVTIAAASSSITEGADAEFTFTRTTMAGALTVNIEVTQEGEYIDGIASTMATFPMGEATATLTISTRDDETEEAEGTITVTLAAGTGYTVGDPASAEVAVTDNDKPMTVGLHAEEEGERLYPNPVGDRLQIHLSKAAIYSRLEVYTLSGRRELTYRIEPKERTDSVDVSGLASGMYVVILTDAEGRARQYRVVKE